VASDVAGAVVRVRDEVAGDKELGGGAHDPLFAFVLFNTL
jgi:hypothetical protein